MNTLPVYLPLAGQFYLLHWWSYDERGHIILAPSEQSLLHTAKQVFEKHPWKDVEVKDAYLIELAAPSEKMKKEEEQFNYEQNVKMFRL